MAERRMFAKTIIASDEFLKLPLSAQALYFHLSMRGDDDGFVNNPISVRDGIGASEADYRELIDRRFVLPFESGVVVIKHWRIHNYIQKDRYKPTVYTEERSRLTVKPNRAYTELKERDMRPVSKMDTMYTQSSIGEIRLDEFSSDVDDVDTTSTERPVENFGEKQISYPTLQEVLDFAIAENLTAVNVYRFYGYYQQNGWKSNQGVRVFDWKMRLREWNYADEQKAKAEKKEEHQGSFDTDDFFYAALAHADRVFALDRDQEKSKERTENHESGQV